MVKIAYFSDSMEIPGGVNVKIAGDNLITIKGPNGGPITKDFSHARGIKIAIEDNKLKFSSHFPKKNTVALAGMLEKAKGITKIFNRPFFHEIIVQTTKPASEIIQELAKINIINNLIVGVQTNYKYICKVCYSHFPCSVRADEKEKMLYVENFLGERAPRKTKYLDTVNIKIDKDDVYLIGPDKEALGQTAANLKRCCKIRKKDPRVFQDGVYLYKKQIGENIIWQIK